MATEQPSTEKEKSTLTTGQLPSLASTLGTSGLSSIPLPQFFGSEKSVCISLITHKQKKGVILEFGSAYTKCGFAGECAPRYFVPAIYTIHSQTLKNKNSGKKKEGQTQRLSLYVRVGKQVASKEEWKEAIEMHLNAIYFQYLQTNPRERRVIVCENVLLPSNFREALSYLLFNKFKVPAVHFFTTQMTSLLPLNKTTGLVVDCGFSESRVLPIVEGIPLLHALSVAPISMSSVLANLRSLILNYGKLKNMNTGEILPINIKIPINFIEITLLKICYVSDSLSPSSSSSLGLFLLIFISKSQARDPPSWPQNPNPTLSSVSSRSRSDVIPSKKEKDPSKKKESARDPFCSIQVNAEYAILVPQSIRSKASEILFQGDLEGTSVPSLILDSLSKCPPDSRFDLVENIVLIGGTCYITGFKKRLLLELKKQLKESNTLDFKGLENQFDFVKNPFQPNYLGWLGGAMLGAVPEALPNTNQRNPSTSGTQTSSPQMPSSALLKSDSNEGNSSTTVGGSSSSNVSASST